MLIYAFTKERLFIRKKKLRKQQIVMCNVNSLQLPVAAKTYTH